MSRRPEPGWTGAATAATVVGLSYLAGASLSRTGWVNDPGLGIIGGAAAGLMVLLARLKAGGRLPLLGVSVVLVLAAGYFAGQDLAIRPGDPRTAALAAVWARRLLLDATLGSGALHSFFFYLVVSISAGWLAWWSMGFKTPLLGLLPVTAVFAVGLLNSTADDSLAVTGFLALLLAMLLLTSFRRLRALAFDAGHNLNTTAGRRYWAAGSGMLVVAVLGSAALPPLTTTDMSAAIQDPLTALRMWLGDATPGAGLAGFSLAAPLSGALIGNPQVVFTYRLPDGSPSAAPVYFRGADLTMTSSGQWRFAATPQRGTIPANTSIQYSEAYSQTTPVSVLVQPVSSPPSTPSALFYPGQLVSVNAPLTISQSSLTRRGSFSAGLRTLDLVEVAGPAGPVYLAQSLVSTAAPGELRAAGTAYPSWLVPYTTLSGGFRFDTAGPYRPVPTLDRIRQLAVRVTANANNPYDQAMAIESYLRSTYRYSLTPPVTPPGKDPIDQFLFSSKTGYCQFFATAMGDMLRSIGIPTRLVNGFGPGGPTSLAGQYAVTESDAHTWVEAYFPGYGWIPFEPTPQPGYPSIGRGLAPVIPAVSAPTPAAAASPISARPGTASAARPQAQAAVFANPGFNLWPGLLVALLLIGGVAAGMLRRRPRTMRGVWRQLKVVSYVAGVPNRP